jgi:endoglucanase
VVLRGVSLIDLGQQHQWRGGVPSMIDTLTGEGWATEVLRFPIYTNLDAFAFSLDNAVERERYMAELLRPAVDYATEKGLYVIIDFHQISNVTERKDQEAKNFWSYLAGQFAAYPNVMYELFNEPIDSDCACLRGTTDECWPPFKAKLEGWLDLVRDAAPDTLVLVGGPSWSQIIGPAADDPIDDANVAYVGHIYPFRMDNTQVEDQISRCAAVHPVFLTEWGFGFESGDEEPYATRIKTLADEFGLSWTAWVADHSWGPPMFNRDGSLNDFGTFVQDWLAE